MAKFYDSITEKLQAFIADQKIFFVATADKEGRVNLSPKGMDSLRVLDGNRIVWLNLTGSGNETAAHLKEVNRMTIMFCAFDGNPIILRLYGNAKTIHTKDQGWQDVYDHFPETPGARQIFDMHVTSVQTSCGFGVPLMEYQENRTILTDWAVKQGPDGVEQYWADRNQQSIDGKPTDILESLSL